MYSRRQALTDGASFGAGLLIGVAIVVQVFAATADSASGEEKIAFVVASLLLGIGLLTNAAIVGRSTRQTHGQTHALVSSRTLAQRSRTETQRPQPIRSEVPA